MEVHMYLQRKLFILIHFKIQNYPHWWQKESEKESCWSIELSLKSKLKE